MERINHAVNKTDFQLSRPFILIMAISCGASVANLYYMQPLLADIAKTFQVTQVSIGAVAMIAQIGYGLGLIFILPVGDTKERRRLITIMLICSSISLFGVFFSINMTMLILSSFALGISTVVPQLIITLSSKLARPEQRGKIIGTMLSGLLIGILVSRTFSGILGEYFGWRIIYAIAAILMLILMIMLRRSLPLCEPDSDITYVQLLRSMIHFIKTEKVLRKASLIGAMMFAAFSAFWTTLIFLLESPVYHMGPQEAGLFGLVGITGALAAPLVGKTADKKGAQFVITISVTFVIASYIVFFLFGFKIWGLVLGVVLLDLGHQSCNVCNQTRVQSLNGDARSRLNAVYIASSFLGAAAGSFLGSYSFAHFGWYGVCIFGIATQIIAFTAHKLDQSYR